VPASRRRCGSLLGAASISKVHDAKEQCAGSVCPESASDSVQSARTLGYASTVTLLAGAISVGVGTVLLVYPPSRSETTRAVRVTPHVGFGSAGVSGTF
jgi:hypothetical protein